MQLEEYFDFLSPLDIRVRGTRIGIETILTAYLDDKLSAEEIAAEYPTLTREQIYATLTLYWQNPERWQEYLRFVDEDNLRLRSEQERNASSGIRRLRALREQAQRALP